MTPPLVTPPPVTPPPVTPPPVDAPTRTAEAPPAETGATEFDFELPRGLRMPDGTVHRRGRMRLATAFDEIEPLKDPRVRSNPGYLVVILLARVITRLGDLEYLSTSAVENLYAADLAFLQDFYQRVNLTGNPRFQVACPHCQGDFEVETTGLGG